MEEPEVKGVEPEAAGASPAEDPAESAAEPVGDTSLPEAASAAPSGDRIPAAGALVGRPQSVGRSRVGTVVAAAVVGGIIGAGALLVGLRLYHPQFFTVPQVQVTTQPLAATTGVSNAAASVYQKVAPAVVLVTNDSIAQSFFGQTVQQTGYGSGVIISSDGYIVTNDHVVVGASKVTVTLYNGKTYPATIVGESPDTDLAVLKISAGSALPTVSFANSDTVVPGETAIAIGNPLGPQFADSVTAGIVSAVRSLLYPPNASEQRVTQMIQTDAAINPGNSGGPLLNSAGQVIGINSMKITQAEVSVSASGLGFAIPSNTVEKVANDLIKYGYVRQAYIGVGLQASPSDALPTQAQTVTVESIVSGSPAAQAGLKVNDVITGWNGTSVLNYYQLVVDINSASPGQKVTLDITRNGKALQVPVTLGLQPNSASGTTAQQSVPIPNNAIPVPAFP